MDFHSLSRRELQALCKSNGIRANISTAAMVEALRCLPAVTTSSVDRTDEIGSKAPPPPPMSAMKEVTVMEVQTHGSLLSRGGRARGKTRIVAAGDTEADVPDQATLLGSQRTVARKAAVPPEAEGTIGEEQEHACLIPRGGRARGKTRKAGARTKTEEEVVVVPAPQTLPVAPEAEPAIGEDQEHGCPLPRGGRARGKTRKAGARKTEEEEEVVPAPRTLPGNKRTVAGEAAAAPVDAEEVTVGIMRTRRSTRSKVKIELDQKEEGVQAAALKEQKVTDKSYGDSEEHVLEKEVTKPQEGQNVTRRAAPHKTCEDLQHDQRTVEEVATAQGRTRRSTRSKVAAAACKEQKADSSDTAKEPEVDPKDDEFFPKVEEATKPQEGKNVTRRATMYKAHEEVSAPEAIAAVKEEVLVTAKRRRRRSARSKVRVAARKAQKADSSDAVNGPPVSDDPKEDQVVEVVEERPTKQKEEEREKISNVQQFASLPKLEDSPILGVVSKPNAADASDKAAFADEVTIKEDDFTFSGEADLSNLLVNTLDRFAKPIYESKDKEEKKGGECWWMLL